MSEKLEPSTIYEQIKRTDEFNDNVTSAIEPTNVRSNYRSSVNKLLKQLNSPNTNLNKLLNNLSNEELGTLIISLKDIIKVPRWIKTLNDLVEIEYRNVDKIYDSNLEKSLYNNNSKEYYINKIKKIENPTHQIHLLLVIELYFDIKKEVGNPIFLKRTLDFENITINELKPSCYCSYLQRYLTILEEISMHEDDYKEYIFSPYDLFLDLLSCSCDELIYDLNFIIDYLSLAHIAYPSKESLISRMTTLIRSFSDYIVSIQNDSELVKDLFFGTHLEVQVYRMNRDAFFESLHFLTLKSNTPEMFNILKNNSLTNSDKIIYYCEDSPPKSIKTFDKNMGILKNFKTFYPLFTEKCKENVPLIYYLFHESDESDKLLDKILYHEFFTWKDEHVNKRNHHSSAINIQTDKLIKNIIKDMKDINLPKINNDEFNTRNIELYKISVLLSEKIRRGYYREHGQMSFYKASFELSVYFRKCLLDLFLLNNIHVEYLILNEFINRFYTLLNEFL